MHDLDRQYSDPSALADRLHSAAIHLLRKLRSLDDATGLSAPRLSALSVVVFAGPITISDLAAAEQVSLPTISRLVKQLEADGLVRRLRDPGDRRVWRVEATREGRRVLDRGRRARVATLAADLETLPARQLRQLAGAAEILQRLAVPSRRPTPPALGTGEGSGA